MAVLKKHWVPVLAPQLFKQEHLGDSFVLETETLAGRGISVNLMNITGDMKKQNLNVSFRVTSVKEGKAHTRVTGIAMQPGSIKRLVRRGRTKIDDSMEVQLKHGQVARIKPLIITKNLAANASATAVRAKARELIVEVTRDHSFETLVSDIVNFKLQRYLRDQLDSVLPIRSVDIRRFELSVKNTQDEEHVAEASSYGVAQETAVVEDDTASRS